MVARKPDLFHVLAAWGVAPQILSEEGSPLVDGDRMTNDRHGGVVGAEGKAHRIPYPAHRTHGVPESEEADAAVAPERRLETLPDRGVPLLSEHLRGVGHEV